MPAASFDALPEDVLLFIFAHATPLSIRRCQRVCQRFRELISTSDYLQYLLELNACGYVEPLRPRLDLSYVEKTEVLRRHNLRWTDIGKITPQRYGPPLGSRNTIAISRLVGGTFVWVGQLSSRLTRITICRLPSNNRGTRFERRDFEFPFGVRYVALDPEQDLAAYLETDNSSASVTFHKIHLRTASTNDPHPRASRQQLGVQYPRSMYLSPRVPDNVMILGTSLAAVFTIGGRRIQYHAVVWNWVTGQELLRFQINHSSTLSCFDLLSQSSFVVSQSLPPGVVNPRSPAPTPCYLEVYCFDPQACMETPAIHQVSFGLPAPLTGRSDPYDLAIQLETTICSDLSSWSSPSIYDIASGDRILWIISSLLSDWGPVELCVPISALLSHVPSETFLIPGNPPLFVPWAEWAPHAFYGDNFGALRYPVYRDEASSQRGILRHDTNGSSDKLFSLVDFNCLRIRAYDTLASSITKHPSDPWHARRALCLKSKFHIPIDTGREVLRALLGDGYVPVACIGQRYTLVFEEGKPLTVCCSLSKSR